MNILVCGGREFTDRGRLFDALDAVKSRFGVTKVIHGAAPGADSLAAEWAAERGIEAQAFPADWKKHGKAAGPIRNQRMLDQGKPDGLVAMPGGAGTNDMCTRARLAGVKVWRPYG